MITIFRLFYEWLPVLLFLWDDDDDDVGYKSTNDTIAYVDNENDKLSDDHR